MERKECLEEDKNEREEMHCVWEAYCLKEEIKRARRMKIT